MTQRGRVLGACLGDTGFPQHLSAHSPRPPPPGRHLQPSCLGPGWARAGLAPCGCARATVLLLGWNRHCRSPPCTGSEGRGRSPTPALTGSFNSQGVFSSASIRGPEGKSPLKSLPAVASALSTHPHGPVDLHLSPHFSQRGPWPSSRRTAKSAGNSDARAPPRSAGRATAETTVR